VDEAVEYLGPPGRWAVLGFLLFMHVGRLVLSEEEMGEARR